MTKTALSLLFCATLLAACGSNPVEIRTQRINIPEALLSCPAEPAIPDIQTQRDVALYIIDLRQFGRSCEVQLGAVRQLQEKTAASPN